MTNKEKINYLRIGLALNNIATDNATCDLILQTIDKMEELKGKFSISDAVDIRMRIDKKYFPTDNEKKKVLKKRAVK